MRGDLQQRIKPMEAPPAVDFNTKKPVKDPTAGVEGDGEPKVDFLTVMRNSGVETKREREAMKNGDALAGAKDYQDFLNKLNEKTKKTRVPKNNLEKDDFLKLFVTQLQHQDPLNPEKSTEMASRLAHFNSLEQMLNVNKNLEKMQVTQTENRGMDMINYLGKEVSVDGGRVRLIGGKMVGGTRFKIDKPATNVVLQVRDASGTKVAEQQLGNLMPGEHNLQWDGKNAEKQRMGDGVYTYSILAQGTNAEDMPISITSIAKITGIDIKDPEGSVYTDLGKVKLEAIKSIGRTGFSNVSGEGNKQKVDSVKLAQAAGQLGKMMGGQPGATPAPAAGQGPSPAEQQRMIQQLMQQQGMQRAPGPQPMAGPQPMQGPQPIDRASATKAARPAVKDQAIQPPKQQSGMRPIAAPTVPSKPASSQVPRGV